MKLDAPMNLTLLYVLGLIMTACSGSDSRSDESPNQIIETQIDPTASLTQSVSEAIAELRSEFNIIGETVNQSVTSSSSTESSDNGSESEYSKNEWNFGKQGEYDCGDASQLISFVFDGLGKKSISHITYILAEGTLEDNEDTIFALVDEYIVSDSDLLESEESETVYEKKSLAEYGTIEALVSETNPLKIVGGHTSEENALISSENLTFQAGISENELYADTKFEMLFQTTGNDVQVETYKLNSSFDANLSTSSFSKVIDFEFEFEPMEYDNSTFIEANGNSKIEAGKLNGIPYIEFVESFTSLYNDETVLPSSPNDNTGILQSWSQSYRLEKTSETTITISFEDKIDEDTSNAYITTVSVGDDNSCKMSVEEDN